MLSVTAARLYHTPVIDEYSCDPWISLYLFCHAQVSLQCLLLIGFESLVIMPLPLMTQRWARYKSMLFSNISLEKRASLYSILQIPDLATKPSNPETSHFTAISQSHNSVSCISLAAGPHWEELTSATSYSFSSSRRNLCWGFEGPTFKLYLAHVWKNSVQSDN